MRGYLVPIKSKTGPAIVETFKVILASGRKPQKIMTDQGTKFFNKSFQALLKNEDIQLFNTFNETKASIALFYGKENDEISRNVTRLGLFLQS